MILRTTVFQTEGLNLLMHYEISLVGHNQQEEKKKWSRIEKKKWNRIEKMIMYHT